MKIDKIKDFPAMRLERAENRWEIVNPAQLLTIFLSLGAFNCLIGHQPTLNAGAFFPLRFLPLSQVARDLWKQQRVNSENQFVLEPK
jgi:hypothetical protein